ncbi:uncharacterized protein LOC108744801 [Agrilus planipennis]|uniref:Uncharacterized protein LOC108744801 n=1 Tax=Agrilus planipennis TaxID=224129 RepID=A0A1W4XTV1_AGRPL|nr:uncharacterized protein LOC108744801 [Agrilus planipennis]
MTTTTIRKSYGNRKLYSFPEDYPLRVVKQKANNNAPKKTEDVAKLLKYIEDNIIGKNNAFLGPFGRRKVVFCDYAASGRSLQFIEEYIVREVLPCFGSTHSTVSITSLQTSLFRQETRDIIRNAVNACDEDTVLFVSDGAKGAINKLIQILDFREPPIVFFAPNEDAENIKLWQSIGATVIRIGETKEGFIDLNDLEEQLKIYQNSGRQMIGCFSAASNVTGILTDDIASTLLLHQYGALSFWDYSVAGPTVLIDMNPVVSGVEENALNKDALYFSGHKFIGGVQTPGVLVAKKTLFQQINMNHNDSFFESQEHKKCFETNEEGSTAAVVESIRAGLVMQLKETVTVANIMQRQEKITKQMLQHIRTIPEIILLGNGSSQMKRLPIFSFVVKHPRGIFLHHNFVCAVLNDVFGIQARAGCACTGSYAQDLLKIDQNLADQFENIILEDRRLSSLNLSVNSTLELLKPGFTRISLPYFMSESELAFVMEAVKMVATEGWKLLPQYIADLNTGEWRHYSNAVCKDRKWLNSVRYVDGKMTMNERRISGPGVFPQNYSECLQTARNLFNRARKTISRSPFPDQSIHFDSRSEKLRWFMIPKEAQNILMGKSQNVKNTVPFNPVGYAGSRKCDKIRDGNTCSSSPSPLPYTSNCNLTTRHLSLPTIDDALHSPSPVPYLFQDNAMFNSSTFQHFIQSNAPNFAVGEAVSSNVFSPVAPQPTVYQRERCLSLGDPTVSPPPPAPLLSPQTRASLGMGGIVRKRNCSCSSQTDLHSLDSDTNTSPSYSLNMLYCGPNDNSYLGRGSPAPNAELQAFVSELATSIKSEIREVTKKVENVLENTDSVDVSYCKYDNHESSSEDGRSDSISATEVAEYLEKVSKEMVNEVKSEIRDVVSAVDVFIMPEERMSSYSRLNSSESDKYPSTSSKGRYTPGSSSETVIQLINQTDSPNVPSDEEAGTSEQNANKLAASTVTSVSSQDSGINLSFHDQEYSSNEFAKRRSSSESSATRHLRKESDKLKFSTLQRQNKSEVNEKCIVDQDRSGQIMKWSSPPKNVWLQCLEALQEYEMIKDGDKVMVCLSGGKDSLCLLHTLLQYQSHVQNRGILFSLGAVTIDPDSSGCDHFKLMPHLKNLGVHYIVEDQSVSQTDIGKCRSSTSKCNFCSFCTPDKRRRLYCAAKNYGYNVLAIGQHLDDFAESFLMSVFHGNSLRTMKAHYLIREHDLRVIRPFAYVREKALRQFVVSHGLPAVCNNSSPETTKERQRVRQVLAQQEILFPKLFTSLRIALKPLMTFQLDSKKSKRNDSEKSTEETDTSDPETDEEPVLKDD